MALQPVSRGTISERVFEQLREQIFNGEWKQGERLPSEGDLAAGMDVSRPTVRHALQRLCGIGLLEIRPGGGSYVREFTPGIVMNGVIPAALLGENTLMEVLEYRTLIEGSVARIACRRANKADIEALEQIYTRMKATQDDALEFSAADFDFHRELARITRNSMVMQTYGIIEDALKLAIRQVVDYRGKTRGLYYHELLLKDMRAKNEMDCETHMRIHVIETLDDVVFAMKGAEMNYKTNKVRIRPGQWKE